MRSPRARGRRTASRAGSCSRGATADEPEPDAGRLDELVGWLVEFHRREEKPMWWRMFERHEMTVEERLDDRDCLAGLVRTVGRPRRITSGRGA